VETIRVLNVGSYNLTLHDANVAAGKTMTINASGLFGDNSVNVNASAETDGKLVLRGSFSDDILVGGYIDTIEGYDGNDKIVGGLGADRLFGGAGNDVISGGSAADFMDGGGGRDRFELGDPTQSSGSKHDEIAGFDAKDRDTIAMFTTTSVAAIDDKVVGGLLNDNDNDNFNNHLSAAIGADELGKHHAVLFAPDSGGFAGELFLIIDANGKRGYQANKDYVVLLTDSSHLAHLDAGDFLLST
jgi:Ca2+-binding RTX toxin-like protein